VSAKKREARWRVFEHISCGLMNGSSVATTLIMTTLPKVFLTVSAAGFAAGGIIDFSGFNVIPAVTVVLPLGAVFFGMFMIALMMEKEMAGFDEEAAAKLRRAGGNSSAPSQKPAKEPTGVQFREREMSHGR
jgi:hypothetical protein